MKAELLNLKNEKVGEIDLPKNIFEEKWRPILVKQALDVQLSNRRKPFAHAKTRAEVSGGGKKPWRQKGTGRARHGSIRSPIWVGGGKAHGPLKEKNYERKINKKQKRIAIFSILSKKLKDGEIKFFDSLNIESAKTNMIFKTLKEILGVSLKKKKLDLLLIPDLENKNIFKAARNLIKTKILSPDSLNVYDLLNYKNIFIDQKAIPVIEKTFKIK